MNKSEVCVALFGEGWTKKLWPLLRAAPLGELIEFLPRWQHRYKPDGYAEAFDSNAGARAALLKKLCEDYDRHHQTT